MYEELLITTQLFVASNMFSVIDPPPPACLLRLTVRSTHTYTTNDREGTNLVLSL